jgi:hypothetical protein
MRTRDPRDATALHRNNRSPVIRTWKEAFAGDYDHLLATTMKYVGWSSAKPMTELGCYGFLEAVADAIVSIISNASSTDLNFLRSRLMWLSIVRSST